MKILDIVSALINEFIVSKAETCRNLLQALIANNIRNYDKCYWLFRCYIVQDLVNYVTLKRILVMFGLKFPILGKLTLTGG